MTNQWWQIAKLRKQNDKTLRNVNDLPGLFSTRNHYDDTFDKWQQSRISTSITEQVDSEISVGYFVVLIATDLGQSSDDRTDVNSM